MKRGRKVDNWKTINQIWKFLLARIVPRNILIAKLFSACLKTFSPFTRMWIVIRIMHKIAIPDIIYWSYGGHWILNIQMKIKINVQCLSILLWIIEVQCIFQLSATKKQEKINILHYFQYFILITQYME